VFNWLWIEKIWNIKLILFQVQLMKNGEFKYCLELLIVYIKCIKIDFSCTDAVSVVRELKI